MEEKQKIESEAKALLEKIEAKRAELGINSEEIRSYSYAKAYTENVRGCSFDKEATSLKANCLDNNND